MTFEVFDNAYFVRQSGCDFLSKAGYVLHYFRVIRWMNWKEQIENLFNSQKLFSYNCFLFIYYRLNIKTIFVYFDETDYLVSINDALGVGK